MKFLLIYLIVINIIGFATFGMDKWKAQNKSWRIPESRLFLCAFLGGGLGCFLGMQLFRHKTKHLRFQIGIPAITIGEILIIYFIIKIIIEVINKSAA